MGGAGVGWGAWGRGARPTSRSPVPTLTPSTLPCPSRSPRCRQAYLPKNTVASYFKGELSNADLWTPFATAKLGERCAVHAALCLPALRRLLTTARMAQRPAAQQPDFPGAARLLSQRFTQLTAPPLPLLTHPPPSPAHPSPNLADGCSCSGGRRMAM